MFFKIINNSIGLNGIVPILLVFDIYPKMTKLDAPFSLITQRAMTMKKTIDEIRTYTTSQLVNNTLNTCHGLSTAFVHDLPINLPVFVY